MEGKSGLIHFNRVRGRDLVGNAREDIEPYPPDISYLLVSPLLPPVSIFLTMSFFTSQKNLKTTVDGSSIVGLEPETALTNHRSLAIFGDSDSFSPVSRLRTWSRELSHKLDSKFEFTEIPGGGHFWREKDTESQMRTAIREYIQSL